MILNKVKVEVSLPTFYESGKKCIVGMAFSKFWVQYLPFYLNMSCQLRVHQKPNTYI
jgi:hypothetical protein